MPKLTSYFHWLSKLALLAFCGLLLILSGSFLFLSPKLPSVSQLQHVEFQTPLKVFTHDKKLIAEFGEKKRRPLPINDIPQTFINALLSAEDSNFYKHRGVDIKGLARAAKELIQYRSIRTGGSTITMQVAKNFFLSREQKFIRKFNEILLALQIETEISKDQILELYLNKIYFGHRAYGLSAASHVYYGKPIGELSLAEFAMIAGLPKAPSRYNPITNPQRATERRNWILERMLTLGHISEIEFEEGINSPVTAKFHNQKTEVSAPYLAEMARAKAIELYGTNAYTDGISVYTTVSAERQLAANHAVHYGLMDYEERHGYRGPEKSIPLTELQETPGFKLIQSAKTPEDVGKELLSPWLSPLKTLSIMGHLQPAIVLNIQKNSALVLLKSGQVIALDWKAISWARRYIHVNQMKTKPKTAAEILAVGDTIRVYPKTRQVTTTTDKKTITKTITAWHLGQLPKAQAALASIDPNTGMLQAIVGGFSFKQSKFNRAIQGGRQAGSAFKPFIYTTSLEEGLTAASIINDAPVVFNDSTLETDWRPTGASNKFFGPTRLRRALYKSLNLVSIRLLQQVGISTAVKSIERFGINGDKLPKDLSLALGSASITPYELASAYTVLANGGYKVEPYFIAHITNNNGDIIYQSQPTVVCRHCPEQTLSIKETQNEETTTTSVEPDRETSPTLNETITQPAQEALKALIPIESITSNATATPLIAPRVVDKRVAYIMNSMLQDVIKKGTGRKALSLNRGDIAGKTGTTNDQFDAWFSGYTPDLVTTTWIGFDTPSSLGRREYGGTASLPVWISYMKAALKGTPETQLEEPEGLITIRIDPETGERARPGQQNAIFEIFREELAPVEITENGIESTTTSAEDVQILF